MKGDLVLIKVWNVANSKCCFTLGKRISAKPSSLKVVESSDATIVAKSVKMNGATATATYALYYFYMVKLQLTDSVIMSKYIIKNGLPL